MSVRAWMCGSLKKVKRTPNLQQGLENRRYEQPQTRQACQRHGGGLLYIWKLRRDSRGDPQNIFKNHLGLEATLKSPMLDLYPEFSSCSPLYKVSVRRKPLFSILNRQIPVEERVPMDHTYHFSVRQKHMILV